MTRFENYSDLTSHLSFTLIDMVKAAEWQAPVSASFGQSSVSCSSYVSISFEDNDGNYMLDDNGRDAIKIRFSDHGDRYGSDITIRINKRIEDDPDSDSAILIDEADIAEMLDEAMDSVRAFRASVSEDE